MLPELTPEQAAKLARLWQWRAGQQGIGYVELSDGRRLHALWRIVEVRDDRPFVWSFDEDCALPLRGAAPTLDDDTTRDGLLRTARAMWQDESLHVVPTCGFAITKHFLRRVGIDKHGQKEMQVWYGESFDRPPGDGIPLAWLYDSEKEALLAAILAAPEAT